MRLYVVKNILTGDRGGVTISGCLWAINSVKAIGTADLPSSRSPQREVAVFPLFYILYLFKLRLAALYLVFAH